MAMSTGKVIALIQAMGGGADPAVIEAKVEEWLDAHPEATTTVQDGSITEQKLATTVAQKLGLISSLSDEIADVQSALEVLEPVATSADVGKALIAKTVVDGKVTEYEFGSTGGSVQQSYNMADQSNFIDGYKYGAYGASINSPIQDENYVCFRLNGIATNDVLVFNTSAIDIHQFNKNGVITGVSHPTLDFDIFTFTVTITNIEQGAGIGISVKKDTLNMLTYLYIAKKSGYDANGKRFLPFNGSQVNYQKKIGKNVHFSIDDTDLWTDLITNENTYSTIFENQNLAILKKMHDEYGMCFTLNTFTDANNMSINDVPTKFKKDFEDNVNWLKFAFHANKDDTRYNVDDATIADQYTTFATGIIKMTGTPIAIDRFTRLNFFTGTLNNVLALKNCSMGIRGLSSPDNSSDFGYYLTSTQRDIVNSHGYYFDSTNGIMFIKTQTRLEQLNVNNDSILNQFNSLQYGEQSRFLEFFTHQSQIVTYYNSLVLLCNWLVKNGYNMVFISEKLLDSMYAY